MAVLYPSRGMVVAGRRLRGGRARRRDCPCVQQLAGRFLQGKIAERMKGVAMILVMDIEEAVT